MVAAIDCQLGHAAMAAVECPTLDFELSKQVIGTYELRVSTQVGPNPTTATSKCSAFAFEAERAVGAL